MDSQTQTQTKLGLTPDSFIPWSNLHQPVEFSQLFDQNPVADGGCDGEQGVRQDCQDPGGDYEPHGGMADVFKDLVLDPATSGHVERDVSLAAADVGRVLVHRVVVIPAINEIRSQHQLLNFEAKRGQEWSNDSA